MRVAYVITRADDIGGAQVHVSDLADHLRRTGHASVVISGRRGPLTERLEARGIEHIEVPDLVRSIRPLSDLRAVLQIRRALRDWGPDLVSTHSSKAGLLGRIAARSLDIPVLFTAHGWAFTPGTPLVSRTAYRWIERAFAPLAARIITVSRYDAQLAAQAGISADRLRAVHNGMPDTDSVGRAELAGDEPRIVMVARFGPQKDHDTLFRALARLTDVPWKLALVGDGEGRPLAEARARELGIADRVEFRGRSDDVGAVLAESQVFALISNWEGFPRSILEAMRAGLPVVASDVGGVSESVEEGRTGLLVPRGDDRTLADRLRKLVDSPSERGALGREARHRFVEEFEFRTMAERTLEVYAEVLGASRSAPGATRT